MNAKQSSRIFVVGFIGSDRKGTARNIATEKGYRFIDLNQEIEKADGRSILRICMMMGEHEYRNKEYEALLKIIENPPCDTSLPAVKPGLVVCCGDGVLLDDMSRDLILRHSLLVIGADLPKETLWQNAKKDQNTYHAFMHFGTEEKRHTLFNALLEKQSALFAPLL